MSNKEIYFAGIGALLGIVISGLATANWDSTGNCKIEPKHNYTLKYN